MTEPRCGCLIPIRLSSERLPGKALLDLNGRPVVHHLLDRVCSVPAIRDNRHVVVCTTEDEADTPLVEAVEAYGVSAFRGARDDILDRFYHATEAFDLDHILQVNGDNPFCSAEYMQLCMEALAQDPELDVANCVGLPIGIASKAFTRDAMRRVMDIYKTNQNDTGFAFYFTHTGLFKVQDIGPQSDDHVLSEARLTMDYEVDLQLFRKLAEALETPGGPFSLDALLAYLRAHPNVMKINDGLEEGYLQRTREKMILVYEDANGQDARIEI